MTLMMRHITIKRLRVLRRDGRASRFGACVVLETGSSVVAFAVVVEGAGADLQSR
jgi:hypothetical protein